MTGYYSCACGTSNMPCDEHHPGAPEMPDDWMETYVAPVPETEENAEAGGPTDGFSAE